MTKYHNRKCEIDGMKFDSLAEGRRYNELKLMRHAGLISELEMQKKFSIDINGQHICNYYADFFYYDIQNEKWITEDIKGGNATKTAAYRLKKKLMKAVLGVDIVEVE